MKFFPELGLCFGTGVSATEMAVETTLTLPPLPETPSEVRSLPCRSKRRRFMRVHSTTQWKPELSAIAEDRVVADGRRREELTTSRSENKVEEKTATKRSSSKYDGNDYRKSCHKMVIPMFSPTPFVF